MRESDFIAPLGLATLFAALKGRQNKMDSQTAYANEVERLNELALQSQEETEDISPEPEEQKQELTSSDLLSETGSDLFNSAIFSAFMPGGLLGKGLAFNTGMYVATGGGNETIQDMVDVIDPEGLSRTVPPRGDGPEFFEGVMDFYRDMAGDDGKLELVPNFFAPGGQSPYLGYKDGGLVTLFESK